MPLDAEVSYRLNKAVLGFGIQNLFDAFPDENLPENASLGTLPYPSHSPFGMNGRFLYGRISYTFLAPDCLEFSRADPFMSRSEIVELQRRRVVRSSPGT